MLYHIVERTVNFKFGGPVEPQLFYNREKEINFLLNRLQEIKKGVQHNYALVGPRRMGKSSILRFLQKKLQSIGVIPLIIDCEGREITGHVEPTLESFLGLYGYSIINVYLNSAKTLEKITFKTNDLLTGAKDKIITTMAELLGHVKTMELKTISEYLSFRIELEKTITKPSDKMLMKLMDDTLSLPEKIAQEKKRFFIVMLDEFQCTKSFNKPAQFLDVFRRHVQEQRRVSYVLSGSSIGMMQDILQGSPFGGHIPIEWVNSFDPVTAKSFLKKGFKTAGRKINEQVTEGIVTAVNAHPAYLNWFGEQCCKEVKVKGCITSELVKRFEEKIFEREGLMHVFEEDLRKISPRGGGLLQCFIEMAGHDIHSPTAISKHLPRITPAQVIIDLRRLEKRGFVRRVGRGNYRIVDAMLEKYVRTKVHTTS